MAGLRAGCYARKSPDREETGKDADAKSVARQIERARQFARTQGWGFVESAVFVDDLISGAEFVKRPGLGKLLDAVKGGAIDVVVVSEQSRLGRDTVRTLALVQAIEDAGVDVWGYLDGRRITLAQDTDEVESFMRSWASSQERRKISQRTRDALRRKIEHGQRVGGRPPYGYRRDHHPTCATLGVGGPTARCSCGAPDRIDPVESEVVRRVFTERARGLGLYKIARGLERDQIRSPSGSARWHQSTVRDILTGTLYRGMRTYGMTRRTKRGGTSITIVAPESEVLTVPALELRLVSDELWSAVEAQNTASRGAVRPAQAGPRKSRPTMSPWLLAPFLACGYCGGHLHAKQNAPGRHFYVCTRKHLAGRGSCQWPKGVPVEIADAVILEAFEEALAGGIVVDLLNRALDEHRRQQADPAPLKAEMNRLKVEIANLVTACARGDLPDIASAIHERRSRVDQLEAQLAGLTEATGIDLGAVADRLVDVLKDWREHLRESTPTAQQVLRKILPERLRVRHARIPFPPDEDAIAECFGMTTDGVGAHVAIEEQGDITGWSFSGTTDYTNVLKELGHAPVTRFIEHVKLASSRARRGSRRGP